MSINIGDKPEMNVVNVGDELTQSQIEAIQNSNGATGTNVFLTKSAGDASYARLSADNTITGAQTISTNSASVALKVTQTGSGAALLIEDSSPDTSPFLITNDGKVRIGTTATTSNILDVAGNTVITVTSGTGLAVVNSGTGNSFLVYDQTGDSTPFVINNDGSVGIKRSSPGYDLDVNGTVNLTTLRFSDGTQLTTAPVITPPPPELPSYGIEAMPLIWSGSSSSWIASSNGLTLAYEGIYNGSIQSGSEYNSAVGYYQPYINFYNGGNGTSLKISPEGIRFSDNTLMTTAGGGGGGGGGDFYSTDGMSVVTKSQGGVVLHGTAGDPFTVTPYMSNKIGFQYGSLYSEAPSGGNYFSLDSTYLYWFNSSISAPTIYSPSGVYASNNSFFLPYGIYAQGLYFNLWNTSKSVYSTTNTYEGGVLNIAWGDSSLTAYGYITIGMDGSTGEPGIRFQKYGTDVGGPNFWDNNVADFTPIADNDVVMATHRIRVRINGVDYYLIAEGPTT